MIRTTIRKYLLQKPTLFPWIAAVLVLAMVIYLLIGLAVMMKTAEGIMVLLVVPYLAPFVILLIFIDRVFRRSFKEDLKKVWVVELIFLLAWGAWFSYTRFSKTVFITYQTTPLVVVLQDPLRGIAPSMMFFNKRYEVDSTNILIVEKNLDLMDWGKFSAKTKGGKEYRQVYPMVYRETDSIHCGAGKFPIQFFMLESDSIPHFVFGQPQFDSMQALICKKIGR